MNYKRIFFFLLIVTLNFIAVAKYQKNKSRLGLDKFNQNVSVKIAEVWCGRSSRAGVIHNGKMYSVPIHINDCTAGKYRIGNTIPAIYNSVVDEVNPGNFDGSYLASRAFLFISLFIFALYVLYMRYA